MIFFNIPKSEASVSSVFTVTNPVIGKTVNISASGSSRYDAKLVYDFNIPGAVIKRVEGRISKSSGHTFNSADLYLIRGYISGSPGNYERPSTSERYSLGTTTKDFAVNTSFSTYPALAGAQKFYVFGNNYAYGDPYTFNVVVDITKIEYVIYDVNSYMVNLNLGSKRSEGSIYRAENSPPMDILWNNSIGFSGKASTSDNKNYSFLDYNPGNFGGWIVYNAELYPGGYSSLESNNPTPLIKTFFLEIPSDAKTAAEEAKNAANEANTNASAAKTSADAARASADTGASRAWYSGKYGGSQESVADVAGYIRNQQLPGIDTKINNLQTSITNLQNSDTLPPVVDVQTVSGARATSGSSIQAIVTVTDNRPGPYTYSINGGSYSALPADGRVTLPVTIAGNNTITVYVKDVAGNIGSKTIVIRKL